MWPELCDALLPRDDGGPGDMLVGARRRGHTADMTTYDRSVLRWGRLCRRCCRRIGYRRRGPSVREELRRTVLWKARQPSEHVAQIDERVVAVTLTARHHAEQDRH